MTLIKTNGNSGTGSVISDLLNMSSLFGDPWWGERTMVHIPSANIKEENNRFIIEMAVPGMKKNDLKVSAHNGVLTISSEKEEEHKENEENYTRREYSYHSFSRSFNLPDSVNQEAVSAKYENGILNITLPKLESGKPDEKKEIPVT